jgi:hypothetical protein
MSVMERTTYRRSRGSNALAFNEPRGIRSTHPLRPGRQRNSIPLFLSDLQDQPDPREFAPLAASQWTSVRTRVVAGGLVVSAFAILVAVAARQIPLKDDPARASDPGTRANVNTSAPRLETASREDIVSDYRAAQQSQVPAARTGNEGAAASKAIDPETLAALTTRAKRLLGLGDIAAARLLLERAANAQDATAAFLLAQTYDPAVLGVRDTRSITPDPVTARDWYRKAASFGSAAAQQRLTQFQN